MRRARRFADAKGNQSNQATPDRIRKQHSAGGNGVAQRAAIVTIQQR